MTPRTRTAVITTVAVATIATIAIINPRTDPTPPAEMVKTSSMGPACYKLVTFVPPAAVYPPLNRPFSHVTVEADGVDYGKRDVERLSRDQWRVLVPSDCQAADREQTVVITFWPKWPGTECNAPLKTCETNAFISIASRPVKVSR